VNDTTPKRHGQRALCPEETQARMEPHLRRLGITRLADVTGLDRVGIPVWIAVRPNSRGLSVSQGKGLDEAAARVSALMESVEGWHAERPGVLTRLARERDLVEEGQAVAGSHDLPRPRGVEARVDRVLPWVCGRDLLTERPTWVPYELVHADATLPRVPGSGAFVLSTNGLASGNNAAEALLHGLCEVVERDATSLWMALGPARRAGTALDLASVDDATAGELLARVAAAALEVTAWDLTSDVGIATVRVTISERSDRMDLARVPAASGVGCHPDRRVALCRAITEAAQSRLTAISGSRDDLTREVYRTRSAGTGDDGGSGGRRFDRLPTFESDTVEEDVRAVLRGLAGRAGPVVAVDLSREGLPVSVWRVVAARLEGPHESAVYQPGPRARALSEERT
jgi:YcaO-like protein with predicted kinase domain